MENISPEAVAAYREHEREMNIRKSRIGCLIGIFLFPVFNVLDYYVYEERQREFLYLRIACSILMAGLYPLFGTRLGRKYHRSHALFLLALPSAAMAWMIYVTEGAMSTYYAGLNFVLLVLAVVLDWTFVQSVSAVLIVLVLYLSVCLASAPTRHFDFGVFFNNMAFLISTGVIIVIGTYFHSRLRLSEFISRWELDKNRRALAAQNQVLEDTLQQLKETELQLVQTEKIVSLGRLSAGIIHEINNPLNFATTGLYILRNQGQELAREKPGEFSEVLRDVEDGLLRVKNIVSDLRSFTHPDAEQRDTVKLADVITASLRFLSNEWRDRVQIDQAVPSDLICHANKNKLTQVFVNLLQNSLDALKQKPVGPEPPIIRIIGRQQGGKIFVSVRDNGEGIDPQNLSRIFDPFFTTRDVGKGMGMGLSICYRIVQELRGQITVTSERGKYCEFTVELPVPASESIAA
jgi:two-component system, sensor histidine kinase PhcS